VYIRDIRLEPIEGGFRAAATIESDYGPNGELWYEVKGNPAMPAPEMVASAFAAACLPTAVWWEADLEIEAPIDADFLYRLPRLARGHARMHKRARTITIRATGASSEPGPNRVVGMSFTGGVDSFYTLRDNLDPNGVTPVRALVTGLGLDTRVDDAESHTALLENLGRVAAEHDLSQYAIRTNFRPFFDPYACPSVVTQGACLIAFAFLLSGSLHTYLIPASITIDLLYPYSSHSLIDGAWIARPLATVCDGWDIHRNDKLKHIMDWPLAMRELRVCQFGKGVTNCGRCEKCIRTMALLALHGVRHAPAFPHPLEPSHIENLRIHRPKKLYWWRKIREAACRDPETAWLATAVGRMLLKVALWMPYRKWRMGRRARNKWPLRRFD
jgi:hypothetical protein